MFYKYEVKRINGEDCLFLYLSLNYEFSSEFQQDESLSKESRNYIKVNNINFCGKKVYYVVNGVVVKGIELNDNSYDTKYAPDRFLINIKFDDGSLSEITLREFLLSVLFSYYDTNIGDELFKAIGILFNTYAYKMMQENNFVSANNYFLNFTYYNEYEIKYTDYQVIMDRFNKIINDISGIYLIYNSHYILPFIHICNEGKTRENSKYPYLKSVKSLWDMAYSNYINIYDYKYEYISNLLNTNINCDSIITSKNYGNNIIFDSKVFTTSEIKDILNLKSSHINIILNKNYIRFITVGVGNSLGLSLCGGMNIESNGGNFNNILSYYFPKVKIFRYIKELS